MARRFESVDAVAGQLLGADVAPDGACGGRIGDQLTDQPVHIVLGLGELIVGVEHDGEFGPMRLALTMPSPVTLDVGEGGQHRFKPIIGALCPVPDLTKVG